MVCLRWMHVKWDRRKHIRGQRDAFTMLRCLIPELDAAEGIAGQLGCGRHAARVPGLAGGGVVGATVRWKTILVDVGVCRFLDFAIV